jgi:hypothetical protein
MLPKAETVKPRKIAVQWVYEENDLGGSPRSSGTQPPRPVGHRAMHHVHADAGILTEAMHYAWTDHLQSSRPHRFGAKSMEKSVAL